MQRNAFKHNLAAGKLQIGLWSSLCSNIAAEIIRDSGFDWILLDTEHSPNEIPDLVGAAAGACRRAPRRRSSVRPGTTRCWPSAALDIGAQSLLFPYVQNAEEARAAVASTRYPPHGIRGVSVAARASRYGRTPGYLGKANDEICVLVQVETRAALSELEAIAEVPGVDGVFIGPSDLAASLGHLGNPQHPDVQKAIKDAVDAAQEGRQAGRHADRQRGRGEALYRLGLSVRRGRRRCRPSGQATPTRFSSGSSRPDAVGFETISVPHCGLGGQSGRRKVLFPIADFYEIPAPYKPLPSCENMPRMRVVGNACV